MMFKTSVFSQIELWSSLFLWPSFHMGRVSAPVQLSWEQEPAFL